MIADALVLTSSQRTQWLTAFDSPLLYNKKALLPGRLFFDRTGSKPLGKQFKVMIKIAPDIGNHLPIGLRASDGIKLLTPCQQLSDFLHSQVPKFDLFGGQFQRMEF